MSHVKAGIREANRRNSLEDNDDRDEEVFEEETLSEDDFVEVLE